MTIVNEKNIHAQTESSQAKNPQDAAPLCMARENARQTTAGQAQQGIDASTGTQRFDAPIALKKLREHRNKKRRLRFQQSKLHRYRAELVALKLAGASFQEIQLWLGTEKHLKIHRSNVMRFLKKLPEMQEDLLQEEALNG
jgi:hypothetical protein